MILRRITSALKRQDWFTVFIETLIVVLGVFLGLQVNNWNEARKDHAEERQLLVRLDIETRALLKTQKAEYALQVPRFKAMTWINPLLFDAKSPRALRSLECGFIGFSHFLPTPTDEMPVLEEAIATGRFDLLSNETVKERLRAFVVIRDRARRQYEENINELFRLPNRHPADIWPIRTMIGPDDPRAKWTPGAGAGTTWWYECDLEKMRTDKAFLADYTDNVARLNSYRIRYEEMIAALEGLETALASDLGKPVPPATEKAHQK